MLLTGVEIEVDDEEDRLELDDEATLEMGVKAVSAILPGTRGM